MEAMDTDMYCWDHETYLDECQSLFGLRRLFLKVWPFSRSSLTNIGRSIPFLKCVPIKRTENHCIIQFLHCPQGCLFVSEFYDSTTLYYIPQAYKDSFYLWLAIIVLNNVSSDHLSNLFHVILEILPLHLPWEVSYIHSALVVAL